MPGIVVDIEAVPEQWRLVARSWYSWQEIVLRGQGYSLGFQNDDPSSYGFWNDMPPTVISPNELRVGSTPSLYFRTTDYGYSVDEEERGIRNNDIELIHFKIDLDKLALWRFANNARQVCGLPDIDLSWYKLGHNDRVTLDNSKSQNDGWFSLTVDNESVERCWMTEMAAISFSHALTLTYSELDNLLRAQIPRDWFTTRFSVLS